MNKIKIVNLFITRRCNLKCSYCGIVRNYKNKPAVYPDMKHYYENEMSTEYVIELLGKFKAHNPDIFIIIYGGEPTLRKDLPDIINFCNKENINYTIITNNTPQVQPLIDRLFEKTGGDVRGFTSSVDPIFNQKDDSDRVKKSISGITNLLKRKYIVKDLVAEITVMRENVPYLYKLIKGLTDHGINSDITFIDTAKSEYYDFSNVTEPWKLVHISAELANQFQRIYDDKNLNIHMKEFLLPEIWDILPSNMDCGIEKDLHNISVDADGSIRLCTRIRGYYTPLSISSDNLFTSDMKVNSYVKQCIGDDKKTFCKLCNHTCLLMSKYGDKVDELVHTKVRS
jgi:MoaA/NifB/PqqE/SkfB family radical SAM enzyme